MTSNQKMLVFLQFTNTTLLFCQSIYTHHFSVLLMEKIYWFCNLIEFSLSWCYRKSQCFFNWSYRAILFYLNPFWLQLCYFLIISLLGFLILELLDHRITTSDTPSANLDLFFMSVSAATVSSLVSLNMEDFSNSQLVVLLVLMFLGGEAFTSMISLHLKKYKMHPQAGSGENDMKHSNVKTDIELGIQLDSGFNSNARNDFAETEALSIEDKKFRCMNYLGDLMLGYLLFVQVCGSVLIFLYFCISPSARNVLEQKGISPILFSVFTSVSSFASCGLIPTNENMMVFKEHSALLLALMPLVMMGSTMFPPCLNLVIWILKKTFPREELDYLLEKASELRFPHLFPLKNSLFLAASDVGFILLQFALFCFLQWYSAPTQGLDSYQKVIGGLFQSVNSRHSGESVFDISLFSPALLVVYIVMMYLPPYTFLLPPKVAGPSFTASKGKGKEGFKFLLPPQPAYPILFIVIICLTEQKHIREDPINFSVLNIAFEVMSAYGNVGLSTGYNCQRLLRATNGDCKDTSVSFSGKWSKKSKIVIIIVMFFGRLKKFTAGGGKAWHSL